jgi:actin-related protein
MPDGTQVSISAERVSILEQMFSQGDATEGFTGVQNMVVDSIGMTDIDIRKDLFQSVILTGGNSCFKGFVERLQRQIPEIAPQSVRVKVIHAAEKEFTPWVGGSILSSLGSFQQMWMSRQEFEEHGAIMIERKCP